MIDSTMYVLTAEGIGIAGVVGVFSTQQLAEAAAAKIMPETDGYHGMIVRALKVDQLYEDQFPYGNGRLDYISKRLEGHHVQPSHE